MHLLVYNYTIKLYTCSYDYTRVYTVYYVVYCASTIIVIFIVLLLLLSLLYYYYYLYRTIIIISIVLLLLYLSYYYCCFVFKNVLFLVSNSNNSITVLYNIYYIFTHKFSIQFNLSPLYDEKRQMYSFLRNVSWYLCLR